MPPDGEVSCGICRTNLDEEGCCPNPHCPANKRCPRCGLTIGPDGNCTDDECRTNRVTINPSERPLSVPYTSRPPRKQSFQDLVAVKKPPRAHGLYRRALESGSFPAPPPVRRPSVSTFDDEEPPTLREKDVVQTKSGIRPCVEVEITGAEDVKKAK